MLYWGPCMRSVSGKFSLPAVSGFCKTSVLAGVFGFTCIALLGSSSPAQEDVHAPDGGTTTFVNNITILPVKNSPFTAVVSATFTRTLQDGTTVTVGNQKRKVARDIAGRIFQERRVIGPINGQPSEVTQTEYSDPATHELFACNPYQHVCRLGNYFMPESVSVRPAGPFDSGKRILTRQDLGRSTIEGVDVIGTLETITINPGVVGNSQPIKSTKEFWYSPLLGINVLVKRSDPRSGTQLFAVSDINISEQPNPQLFTPPADYQIIDVRAASRGLRVTTAPPPPPAK